MEDDETGADHRSFLQKHGFTDSYHHCDVTSDPTALLQCHATLKRLYG